MGWKAEDDDNVVWRRRKKVTVGSLKAQEEKLGVSRENNKEIVMEWESRG